MKKISLFILIVFIRNFAFAQAPTDETNEMLHSQKTWFTYFGHYKLSDKWGIHADVQFRMDEDIKFSEQNLVRTGLVRYLNPEMNLTAGYAYINTLNAPLDAYFSEHRIWEQFIFTQRFSPIVSMTHRFRLEQRFIETLKVEAPVISTSGYSTGNRVRYFNRTVFDIPKKTGVVSNFYLALQNETFFKLETDPVRPGFFDRNRFLAAFGIFHDKKTRMEIGYMNQLISGGRRQEVMNHIIHVSLLQSLNFMKPTE